MLPESIIFAGFHSWALHPPGIILFAKFLGYDAFPSYLIISLVTFAASFKFLNSRGCQDSTVSLAAFAFSACVCK